MPSVNQPAQQQGAPSALGPKNAGAGSHGVKSNQVSACNTGPKAPAQSASAVGGTLKTKCKRERSTGAEAGETRTAVGSASDTDAKGGERKETRRSAVKNNFLLVKAEADSPACVQRPPLHPEVSRRPGEGTRVLCFVLLVFFFLPKCPDL